MYKEFNRFGELVKAVYPKGNEVMYTYDGNSHKRGAVLGKKLNYQFGKATGSQHNIARSKGMYADLLTIGFEDTVENRAFFRRYYNSVLNDASNIVGTKQISYKIGNKVVNYTATYRESFLMGKYGGAIVNTTWDGDKLISMQFKLGKRTRFRHG